jgi:NAD(P)-dependent dehydrogenase (short-subunit alcohol dehydrogenase family)
MTSQVRVALVTGGGTGIGQAAALELQKTGHNVVIIGRRAEPLQETIDMGLTDGPEMLAITADIGDPEQIRAAFAKTKEKFGRLDVLFNNAGVGAPRIPMEELKLEDWKKAVDINLTGSFVCSQEAIKIMKDQKPMGGRIINNGSISAHSPRPDTVAYTSTKHAMTGLTKSIALDGRRYDIACSQIDIGNADTPLGGRMKHGVPQANGEVMAEAVMDAKHCGEMVAYIAGLPLGTNVLFVTIMATKMPFVGRG